jgi:hypothetical protein
VRARHYSYLTGAWSTVDPLWPGQPAVRYVDGRATLLIDLLGSGNMDGCGEMDELRIKGAIAGAMGLLLGEKSGVKQCLNQECSHNSPPYQPPKGGDPPGDGTMWSCLMGYLQNPKKIKFHCCGFNNACTWACRFGNRTCAWGFPGPGGFADIYFCPEVWNENKCGSLECTIMHEILHSCSKSSGADHGNSPPFSCLKNLPACKGSKAG